MYRLMMPDFHTKQSSNATTDNCQYQQGCLRYAPAALLGLPFIYAINEEGRNIDNYQII